MKAIKYFTCIVLLAPLSKIYSQDHNILIFDPTGVSTSFQYTLSQLTEDSVFVADSLDDSIFNYDALYLFINHPFILSQDEGYRLIEFTTNNKPIYIYSELGQGLDSVQFWNYIGVEEIVWFPITVLVDSVNGIDTSFFKDVKIDTSFWNGSVPAVVGNIDPVLLGHAQPIDLITTYCSSDNSLRVIIDLYNLIDDEGFLRRVLEYFELIPQQQNVQIQFFPQFDTALVNGGCCTPQITAKNLSSTSIRDSISIEPGPFTMFYYIDSTGNQILIDNYYFIVIDSLNEFEYELWYHPKSFNIFTPIIIPFDSSFYTHENDYDIQLIVSKNGFLIDSLSQPFHADYGLDVESNDALPNKFSLSQNFPNPFNPSTVISYQLLVTSNVTLKVYDVLGNEIATLVNEEKQPGVYEMEFSPEFSIKYPASGIYFYQLKAGNYIETKKMVLLKLKL